MRQERKDERDLVDLVHVVCGLRSLEPEEATSNNGRGLDVILPSVGDDLLEIG